MSKNKDVAQKSVNTVVDKPRVHVGTAKPSGPGQHAKPENMLPKAQEAARQGRFGEALQLMAAELALPRPPKNVLELCSLWAWNYNDFSAALAHMMCILSLYGDSVGLMENRLSCLTKLKQYDEAYALGQSILQQRDADLTRTYSTLALVAQRRNDHAASIRYGELALIALDAATPQEPKVALPPRKRFNPDTPKRNIISFSLWGDRPRYLRGAVRNALLALDIYPGWTCRFYVDETVPQEVRKLLFDLGAQVWLMPRPVTAFEGLGWRFQVWDDAEVDFCLIRDCDSVVSPYEAGAVHAWLASDAWFHIMRCWYTHTDLILAGMWGGATGGLCNIYSRYKKFAAKDHSTRTLDQEFLRSDAWPLVKYHALIHDRFFRLPGTTPFPHTEFLPPDWHVGCDEVVIAPQRQDRILAEYARRMPCLRYERTATFTISWPPKGK